MSNQQPNLLVAEDSEDDYRLLEMAVLEAGFKGRMEWVRGGDEALARLRIAGMQDATAYDLIVLDHHLPCKNSTEVLAELTAAKRLPLCPIIILTNLMPAKDRNSFLSLGVSTVLEKPCDLDGYTKLGHQLLQLLASK